jgi:tyrosyl-tRNA synthetase
VHGEAQRDAVVAASQALFGRGSLEDLDESTLAAALAELPQVVVPAPAGGASLPTLVDLLAESGLCASRSAARRTVAEGGAYVNNARIADEGQVPGEGDLLAGRWLVLRRGKRHLAAVEVSRSTI